MTARKKVLYTILALAVFLTIMGTGCNLFDSNCSCTISCPGKPLKTQDGYCPVFPAWGECSYTEHCDKGDYTVYEP